MTTDAKAPEPVVTDPSASTLLTGSTGLPGAVSGVR